MRTRHSRSRRRKLVVPLCEMPSNLLAWLGWQEAWELTTGQRPYRFKNMA